ncbi:MAG TPA: hypothetical protein VFF73_35305 [Planctomycetota bacterium]|nr:hypothetical protein [Planctomycetota bacterium]
MSRRPVVAVAALLLLASTAPADDDFAAKKKAAIEKGVAWLKQQQTTEGFWKYENLHPALKVYPMSQGAAALGALTLLKCGVSPEDGSVKKAFDYIRSQEIQHPYSAGLVLLALDALQGWRPPEGEKTGTAEKKGAGSTKLTARDLELAEKCVDFLQKAQLTQLWRYTPKSSNEDSSNAQYALLGLDAAERIGVPVNKDVYLKAQAFYVEHQEKDGPEVPAFAVPGADLSMAELRAVEKEAKEKLEKIERAFKGKKPGETDADGHTKEDVVGTTERDVAKKVFKTTEKLGKMRARGFPYALHDTGDPDDRIVSGGMTASGMACLFICKAHLDGTPAWKPIEKNVNQALRDGAAWLQANWTVQQNPKARFHHYYWLYSLERASVMNLVPSYGTHDWDREGSELLVGAQKADGSWDAAAKTTVGPTVDTMFALLFLARGTTPIVKLPDRVVTGVGGEKK